MGLELNSFTAVSSIDGRYEKITAPLRNYFSEYALQKGRVRMEIEYLLFLSMHPEIKHVRELKKEEIDMLRGIYQNFNHDSMERIKEIERRINHDVKSVEYFIKEKIKGTSLEDISESTHFSLTSEDCTNVSYAMLVNDSLKEVYVPKLREIVEKLVEFAKDYADVPMLARTHGQSASPTTVGKEFGIFSYELALKLKKLSEFRLPAKVNNATGNYNALLSAYPNIDFLNFSNAFLESLGLDFKVYTTQVDGYIEYSELFNLMKEINTIIKKMDIDMWLYISYEDFVQKRKKEEVGSSTMPHKVNPIRFENSEGNIRIANAIFEGLNELPMTRLQRDLSGSTMLRAMGEAFGHTLVAWENTLSGLNRIEPNIPHLKLELESHPEILAEPIQQILRREGFSGAYELLKQKTRGEKIGLSTFINLIDEIDLPETIKDELRNLIKSGPENYVGAAVELAKQAVNDTFSILKTIYQ